MYWIPLRCMKRSTASFCIASLRVSIVFWASTLEDEFCQIASKDKAISKAKLIPLVFFSASRLCDLCDLRVSASLWRHVHHAPRLCVLLALRASRSASRASSQYLMHHVAHLITAIIKFCQNL